jgi:hypothetical protein
MVDAAARAARINVLVNSGQLDGEHARAAEAEAELAVAETGGLAADALENVRRRGH